MFGTGVDLFFVISGFCMYLLYAQKQNQLQWSTYVKFLQNRWLRIAPAFYVAIVIYSIGHVVRGDSFPWKDAISHATFTATWLTNPGFINAPFWSLATEAHFYLLLPVFIATMSRYGFWRVAFFAIVANILIRCVFYLNIYQSQLNEVALVNITYQVPIRLVEFVWGMCVAKLFSDRIAPPEGLRGAKGFILGIAFAFCGRAMETREVLLLVGAFSGIFQVLSVPTLSFGYALMLWTLVSDKSVFERILCLGPVQAVGRWSYSMYLWHGGIYTAVGTIIMDRWGVSSLSLHVGFWFTLILLLPLSSISYTLFEASYFRSRGRKKDS
jgi:peptidoglycan/LPS O-acetylase OafA/YrhL